MLPGGSRRSQDAPDAPRRLQTLPRRPKTFKNYLEGHQHGPNTPQDAPRTLQDSPKTLPRPLRGRFWIDFWGADSL